MQHEAPWLEGLSSSKVAGWIHGLWCSVCRLHFEKKVVCASLVEGGCASPPFACHPGASLPGPCHSFCGARRYGPCACHEMCTG